MMIDWCCGARGLMASAISAEPGVLYSARATVPTKTSSSGMRYGGGCMPLMAKAPAWQGCAWQTDAASGVVW